MTALLCECGHRGNDRGDPGVSSRGHLPGGPCFCGCRTFQPPSVHTAPPLEETGGAIPIEIPDGVVPIVGYRGWNINDEGNLCGVTHDEEWPPGKVTAEAVCMVKRPKVEIELHNIPKEHFTEAQLEIEMIVDRWAEAWIDPHEPPNENCRCGLYARLERDEVSYGEVHGRIEAWGKIVKGSQGYRAQFARVTGLYRGRMRDDFPEGSVLIPRREEVIDKLADRYDVPILDLPRDPRPIPVHDLRASHV